MRSANFVEEAASSIAGTNGNGAVTMTQVDGLPRFSHAYGAAATVRYTIEDTVNRKLETGIGVVAGGVLTRSKILATWDGTNYVTVSPTPLAFGAAPAAGTVRVRVASMSENVGANHGGPLQITLSNADAWNQYPLSGHMNSHAGGGSGNGLTAGTEYYLYYRLDNPGLLQGIQVDVTGASTGSAMKVALYALDANSMPGRKIVDFGLVDTGTTGIKTLSDPSLWTPAGPPYLTPGWYVIGYQAGYGIALRGYLNSGTTSFGYTPVGRASGGYAGYKSVISRVSTWENGALLPDPPNLSSATILTSQLPWFGLKVTS